MNDQNFQPDPKLDLIFERTVDVSKELIWEAWTNPEQLVKWFTPEPWQTIDCEIDLRPGGIFRTVMRSPDGKEILKNNGCYLEVVQNERLVWTDAMGPGFRPSLKPGDCLNSFFTARVLLTPEGNGTRYTAIALHSSEEIKNHHEKMGFHAGWGAALDQLVAMVKSLSS